MTIKKSFTYLSLLAIILVVVIYFISNKEEVVEYTTVKIEKGKIVQTVSETGTVKSDLGIDLSFAGAGKLQEVRSDVGDRVRVGDAIALLDYSSLEISRAEAQANLDVNKETLNKLLSGATAEEISVSKAAVDQSFKHYESAKNELDKTKLSVDESNRQAEKDYNDLKLDTEDTITSTEYSVQVAKTNLENTKKTYQNYVDNYSTSAITACNDKLSTINNALDVIDETLTDDQGEDYIGIKNREQLVQTKDNYNNSLSVYNSLALSNVGVSAASENYEILKMVTDTLSVLSKTFDTLHGAYVALENSITSSSFTLSDIDSLKTGISSQQTTVSAAISSLQAIEQNLNSSILNYDTNVRAAENSLTSAQTVYQNALKDAEDFISTTKIAGEQQVVAAESRVNNAFEAWQVAQAQFKQLTAKANKHDVSLSQARVRQAEAALNSVRKQIENSIIVSPIDGIVTRVNFEEGEQVSASMPVVSLIAQKKFEIEVMITETDIAKIGVSNKVQITLDTYGDDVIFYGEVFFIDPAETVIDGVIYYKTKINFDTDERAIKSGMTANVSIIARELEDVLIIPNRALIKKGDKGVFARILKGGIVEEKKVEIGLYGDGGIVEILSGLEIGEDAVTYIK